jgi:large subunit ribosomal protein L6
MSRIGKMPIPIPNGVDVKLSDGEVQIKGPKGLLTVKTQPGVTIAVEDGQIVLTRANDEHQSRAYHGLNRALLANATTGVSEGWKKELEIVGIGYRAEKKGNAVSFSLGHSHPIDYPVPEGIEIDVDSKANRVTVAGIDRQRVGQVAAEIRALRPPEPYKGKGVRYADERVRTKAGKQGVAT